MTKKFNLFLENAYYTINLGEQTDSLKCHKHHIEYHVKGEFHKLIETKEATIVEKLSTDIRLGQKVKVLSSIKKIELENKLEKTNELNEQISAIKRKYSQKLK